MQKSSYISIFNLVQDFLRDIKVFCGSEHGMEAVKKLYLKNPIETDLETFNVHSTDSFKKCQQDIDYECDFQKILKTRKAFPLDFLEKTANNGNIDCMIKMAIPKSESDIKINNNVITSKDATFSLCQHCYFTHKLTASLTMMQAAHLTHLNFDLSEKGAVLDKEMPISELTSLDISFFGVKSFLDSGLNLQIQNYLVLSKIPGTTLLDAIKKSVMGSSIIKRLVKEEKSKEYLIARKRNKLEYFLYEIKFQNDKQYCCIDDPIIVDLFDYNNFVLNIVPIEKLYFSNTNISQPNLDINLFLSRNQTTIDRCFATTYRSIGKFNHIPDFVPKKESVDKALSSNTSNLPDKSSADNKNTKDSSKNTSDLDKFYIYLGIFVTAAAFCIYFIATFSSKDTEATTQSTDFKDVL